MARIDPKQDVSSIDNKYQRPKAILPQKITNDKLENMDDTNQSKSYDTQIKSSINNINPGRYAK